MEKCTSDRSRSVKAVSAPIVSLSFCFLLSFQRATNLSEFPQSLLHSLLYRRIAGNAISYIKKSNKKAETLFGLSQQLVLVKTISFFGSSFYKIPVYRMLEPLFRNTYQQFHGSKHVYLFSTGINNLERISYKSGTRREYPFFMRIKIKTLRLWECSFGHLFTYAS